MASATPEPNAALHEMDHWPIFRSLPAEIKERVIFAVESMIIFFYQCKPFAFYKLKTSGLIT